ncbi:MAG: hypothetical protein ABR552_03980 [Actinomycetota bacterium]
MDLRRSKHAVTTIAVVALSLIAAGVAVVSTSSPGPGTKGTQAPPSPSSSVTGVQTPGTTPSGPTPAAGTYTYSFYDTVTTDKDSRTSSPAQFAIVLKKAVAVPGGWQQFQVTTYKGRSTRTLEMWSARGATILSIVTTGSKQSSCTFT